MNVLSPTGAQWKDLYYLTLVLGTVRQPPGSLQLPNSFFFFFRVITDTYSIIVMTNQIYNSMISLLNQLTGRRFHSKYWPDSSTAGDRPLDFIGKVTKFFNYSINGIALTIASMSLLYSCYHCRIFVRFKTT